MKRFVAKDLMVSVLPAEGAVAGLNCGGCTCTNKGSEKMGADRCRNEDLAILQANLDVVLRR
jgi:hypothetical protein